VIVVALVVTLVRTGSASDSESLDDEESDDESGEEDFFGPSDKVALVSEPCFLIAFLFGEGFVEDSLSELEEEASTSESGNGNFCAMELVEESEPESEPESESEDEESLSEELELTSTCFAAAIPFDPDDESESNEVSAELEAEEDSFLGVIVAVVLAFFDLGASSSELESESAPEDEELLKETLRFKLLMFGFWEAALTTRLSLSSSASLSLSELESAAEVARRGTTAGGAEVSNISTSLSSSSLLSEPRSRGQHVCNLPRSRIRIRTRVTIAARAIFVDYLRTFFILNTIWSSWLILFLL